MIELSQHIEYLLLYNDCVIVPGFGGFIAHHIPAKRMVGEHQILPPTRTIGFNPQLKLNDGLLTQSFMDVYGTDFGEAGKMLKRQVDQLQDALQEDGKVEFPHIGLLRYNVLGKYDFIPYNNRLTATRYYGLDVLSIAPLTAIKSYEKKTATTPAKSVKAPAKREAETTATPHGQPKVIAFKPKQTSVKTRQIDRVKLRDNVVKTARYAASIAAFMAVLIGLLVFARPLENTDLLNENQATLSPAELLGMTPMTMSSIDVHVPSAVIAEAKATAEKADDGKTAETEADALEIAAETATTSAAESNGPAVSNGTAESQTVAHNPANNPANTQTQTPATTSVKRYNIIVASVSTEEAAQQMASQLRDQGHAGAKAIIGDGKSRVSVASYATEAEAYQAVSQLKSEGLFDAAWVLRR